MANNWAIVVGINHYDFLPNASLKFAAADALAMRKFLCEEAGFDSDKVTLCGNAELSSKKASRPILREILIDHRRKALNADNLWFFFSGHGFGGERFEDYLMTVDGNPYDLKETAISVSFVADCLRESKAKNIFLILDMCRDEILDMEKKGIVELNRAEQQAIVMIYSCDRHQSSYEISAFKQGAFTYALLEGLRKQETLGDLEKYLELRIPELHESVGKQGRRQTPRVNPSPGWKLNKSVFFPHAVEVDIAALMGRAIDAEFDGDLKKALNLWEQVKVAAKSEGDRSRAIKKIEDLTKRLTPPKSVLSPSTPKPKIKSPSQENPVAKWDFAKKTNDRLDRSPLPTYIPTVKKPVSQESQLPLVPQAQKSQSPEFKPTPAPAAREIKVTPVPPTVSALPRKADCPTLIEPKESKPAFSWITLDLLVTRYGPIGILIGLSFTWPNTLITALMLSLVLALTLTLDGSLVLVLALAWTLVLAWALSLDWELVWRYTDFGIVNLGSGRTVTLIFAWTGALVGTLVSAGRKSELIIIFVSIGFTIGSGFTIWGFSMHIETGIGVGIAALIYVYLLYRSTGSAGGKGLYQRYTLSYKFMILIVPTLGSVLGRCLVWVGSLFYVKPPF